MAIRADQDKSIVIGNESEALNVEYSRGFFNSLDVINTVAPDEKEFIQGTSQYQLYYDLPNQIVLGSNSIGTGSGSITLGNAAGNYSKSVFSADSTAFAELFNLVTKDYVDALEIKQERETSENISKGLTPFGNFSDNTVVIGNSASCTGDKSICIGNKALVFSDTLQKSVNAYVFEKTGNSDIASVFSNIISSDSGSTQIGSGYSIGFSNSTIGSGKVLGSNNLMIGKGISWKSTYFDALVSIFGMIDNDFSKSIQAAADALKKLSSDVLPSSVGYSNVGIGNNNVIFGEQLTSIGNYNFGIGEHSISIGNNVNGGFCSAWKGLSSSSIVSIINDAESGGFQQWFDSIKDCLDGEVLRNEVTTKYSVAIGDYSSSGGHNSIAMGAYANSGGNKSTALGSSSNASARGAVAIGHNSAAAGENSIAVGSYTSATCANSFVLGAGLLPMAMVLGLSATWRILKAQIPWRLVLRPVL